MSVYITGDTHGTIDLMKVINWYNLEKEHLTKNDYLIICGDVNIPPFILDNSIYRLETLRYIPINDEYSIPLTYGRIQEASAANILKHFNCTILFVDGNHENFKALNSIEVEEWHGGKVHKIEDNIIHLMRGQVYNIEGKKFFAMGGATSPDKRIRTPGLDWFSEEDVSFNETEEALNNLEKHNNKVDYIITHTIGEEFMIRHMKGDVNLRKEYMGSINTFLDYINDIVEHKDWYFGHIHLDKDYDNKHLLYERIIKII